MNVTMQRVTRRQKLLWTGDGLVPVAGGATESVELSLKIGMIFLSKGVDGRGQG